ncbi:SIR2 family protein [Methanobacterium sp. MBAC-LM]|uniref:SIR2 family protein n=1 Tax=Methanobacterium sp. MBAC-LM TaxID=3412034 RepID=UPI003C72176E
MTISYDRNIDAFNFEKYILSLLNALAKSKDQEFYSEYMGENYVWHILDGFAPNGLGDVKGSTAIEIKYITRLTKNRVLRIKKQLDSFLKSSVAEKVILVANIKSKSKIDIDNPNVIIWDNNDIKELEKKFPEVSFQFSDVYLPGFLEYSKKRANTRNLVRDTVAKYETIQYNENKKSYIKKLQHAFKHSNLVLCLGAGVSIDEGLPNWKNLIERLITDSIKENHNKTIGSLDLDSNVEFKSFSYITMGRFIKKALKSGFYNKFRKLLYQDYVYSIKPNSILYHVTDLCKPVLGKTIVHSIITYNYDDVLEYYLEKKGIKKDIIYREYEVPKNRKLPIYHVHGFLPQKGKITPEMENSIVFEEKEYHTQYKDPYSWQNLIQLNLLKEKTVLFVGLSMNDPNLRRLLDIAKSYSKDIKHFAIIKDHWETKSEKLANIYRSMEEDVFEELGVNVIWFRDYSEINEIITEINNGIYYGDNYAVTTL